MVKLGLFVRLHAKPGKEAELASLLEGGLGLVEQEPGTPLWFAVRFDASTFAIFDAFNDEAGRKAHLTGRLAAALLAKAPDLLAKPPVIEQVDVIASKVAP
jgi:quinol monooxygenase YgiN